MNEKTMLDIEYVKRAMNGDEEAFKEIYKQRTSTERVNNRILNDYKLHSMVIHTVKRYSFITMIIGVCLHLDAGYKQQTLKAA